MKKQQQTNTAFLIFTESSQGFCAGMYRSHFECSAYVQNTEICRFALGSAQCMPKRHEVKKKKEKFSEENIASAKQQTD